jgi:BNR repeat-like domain
MKLTTILVSLLFSVIAGVDSLVTPDLTDRIERPGDASPRATNFQNPLAAVKPCLSRDAFFSQVGKAGEPERHVMSPEILPPPPPASNSRWEPVIQFTSGWGQKWFYALAGGGNTVHFAQGNNNTILYRRSTDEGTTWSQDTSLGTGRIYLERPFVVDGSNVHLVYFRNFRRARDWCCPRELGDMFLRASRDGGVTWQPEVRLTTSRSAFRVAMAASGSNVYVVWMDFRSGIWDIYYRRSTNNGSTWGPEIKLVAGTSKIGSSVGAERPSITVLGTSVHVAWMDGRDGTPPCYTLPECTEIYYKRSDDNGATWGPDIRLTNDKLFSGRPSIEAIAPSTVLVSVDQQEPGGEAENVHIKKSIDDGNSWGTSQKLSFLNRGSAGHNAMMTAGSSVHVAWFDDRDTSNREVFYRASKDAGKTWSPEENVSQAPGESSAPFLAATENYIHAAWGDRRTGVLQVFYRRRGMP